ncbi:MAG: prepilin-type N-terminal cleavage/methylation domain-containing protein [Pseudomonadota bacterium]
MSSPEIKLSKSSEGFTLLELVVVLLILASVAGVALSTLGNNVEQQRFDDTRRKIKTVKQAILGFPDRTINGAPQISGFVADVGRLPKCLEELLTIAPTVGCDPNFDGDNDILTNTPPDAQTFAYDATSNLWAGWRGPYLDVVADLDGVRRFRDGWGNQANAAAIDSANFGWTYTSQDSDSDNDGDSLNLSSNGQNNIADDTTGTGFELQYPSGAGVANTLVFANELKTVAATYNVPVNFYNDGIVETQDVCLRMYFPSTTGGGRVNSVISTNANITVPENSSFTQVFQFTNIDVASSHVSFDVLEATLGTCTGASTRYASANNPLNQIALLSPRTGPLLSVDWISD